MLSFSLSKNRPVKTFIFNGPDSFLCIKKIAVITNSVQDISLSSIISCFKLVYELSGIVYKTPEGRVIDDRKKSSPITMAVHPYQTQPIFELDKQINNELYTVGWAEEQMCYKTLKLELLPIGPIKSDFELKFYIEPYDLGEEITNIL